MRDTFTTFPSFLETCQKKWTEEMFYPVGFLAGELRCQGSIEGMHPGSSWLPGSSI